MKRSMIAPLSSAKTHHKRLVTLCGASCNRNAKAMEEVGMQSFNYKCGVQGKMSEQQGLRRLNLNGG